MYSEEKTAKIEQTLIAHLIKHPEESFQYNCFLSTGAKAILKAIKKIVDKSLTLNLNSLSIEVIEFDSTITSENLSGFFDFEYSIDNIPSYKKELEKRFLLEEFKTQDVAALIVEAEQSIIDVDKLKKKTTEMQSKLAKLDDNSKVLWNIEDWISSYKDITVKRAKKDYYYPTGDTQLDKYATLGFAPTYQTVIFGSSGTGKSTFGRSLINRGINLHIPTVYNTLEMDRIVTFDTLLSSRTGISLEFLMNRNADTEQSEQILKIIEREEESLKNNKKFLLLEDASLSLTDLDNNIPEMKRLMGVDYFVLHNDLATMLKDYGGEAKASTYEDAQNFSHEICKRHNIHMVNYVQSLRDDNKIQVKKEEDLEKFRPKLSGIKNSSAFEERSRLVLGIFRKKYYAERYYRSINSNAVDLMEDIMEVQFLKQNMGTLPVIKYLFIPEIFRLAPYKEPDKLSLKLN